MTQDSRLVVVRSFSQPHEAHVARSALQAAGIHATVADDNIVSANWMYSNAVGGVKVLVPAEDAETARLVLATPADVEEIRDTESAACPRCGGHDVATVTRGKRLLFLSWLVLGFPVFPALRRVQCNACGHRFGAD